MVRTAKFVPAVSNLSLQRFTVSTRVMLNQSIAAATAATAGAACRLQLAGIVG